MQAGLSSDCRCPACYIYLGQKARNDESTQPPTCNDRANDSGHGKLCRQCAWRHHLKLLDQVAYACASRYAGRYVVTLSVTSGLPSASPCRRASHLSRLRQLDGHYLVGSSIKVITENIRLASCAMPIAASFNGRGGQGASDSPCPPLKPSTPDQQRRFEGS